MHPGAHEIVEQVVPVRDRGKQFAHLLRAVFVGPVEFTFHGAGA
jgi:hypothetical protein